MRLIMYFALLSTLLVACNKVSYVSPITTPTGKTIHTKGHFFVAGLIGTNELDAHKACPEGVSRVLSRSSFTDILLSVVTVLMYSPRSYEVSCGTRKVER